MQQQVCPRAKKAGMTDRGKRETASDTVFSGQPPAVLRGGISSWLARQGNSGEELKGVVSNITGDLEKLQRGFFISQSNHV